MIEKFILTGYAGDNVNFLAGLRVNREKRILTLGGKTRFQTEMEEILINFIGVTTVITWKQTQKNKIKFDYCYPKTFLICKLIFELQEHGYQVEKGIKSLERIMC